MDVGVPDRGHGTALYDEEEDLGEVAGGDEGDDDVEEEGEGGACSVDDSEDAEGY